MANTKSMAPYSHQGQKSKKHNGLQSQMSLSSPNRRLSKDHVTMCRTDGNGNAVQFLSDEEEAYHKWSNCLSKSYPSPSPSRGSQGCQMLTSSPKSSPFRDTDSDTMSSCGDIRPSSISSQGDVSSVYDNTTYGNENRRRISQCREIDKIKGSPGRLSQNRYRARETDSPRHSRHNVTDTGLPNCRSNLSKGHAIPVSSTSDSNKTLTTPDKSDSGRSAKQAYGEKISPIGDFDERVISARENGDVSLQASPCREFGQLTPVHLRRGHGRLGAGALHIDCESNHSSIRSMLQIDEEPKKQRREDDCAMSTILQPTAMLRREIALHDACKTNKVEMVEKILQDKIDLNCKNNLDRTPLHWACAKGNLQVVGILVEHGADLEAKDKYGMRPLLWAALYGHLDVVRLLVNAGAVPTCTSRQGMGLLHCATQNNHIHVMNFIFQSLEHVDINSAEKNEKTALHIAAEEGHLDAVMRLIDLRCDVNKRDADCRSAIHVAAKQGHYQVVKRLLMVGVNVDDREADGRTALHFAAEENHLETIEVLADFNAGPNAETIKETTPLHCAAAKGHQDVCLRLIKLGANINSQNHQGNTALHMAVNGNYRDLTQVLVQAKAEIDLPNHRLQTPLHLAVECGYQDVVEVLLVGNASLSAKEKSGKTALHVAARGSHVTIVDMIIKAERYFSMNRDYHENDLDFIDPHRYLRQPTHPSWPQMKELLWTLATKNLKAGDWKKLAMYWKFTPDHIRCIEHQYTGTSSHKEHGFRLLMIWLHGVRKDENVTKLLFEGLVAIDKRALAEQIRRRSNNEPEKLCIELLCGII